MPAEPLTGVVTAQRVSPSFLRLFLSARRQEAEARRGGCCTRGINVIPPPAQYDIAGPENLVQAPRSVAAFAGEHAEYTLSQARFSRRDRTEAVLLALSPWSACSCI